MTGQGWVENSLAVAMLATAGYCAACLLVPRLRRATPHHDADLVHVVMAVAMAAMLLGVARPLWGGPLVLAFAMPATWFAYRAIRSARATSLAPIGAGQGVLGNVQLSVGGVAMIYMSGVVPGFGSASGSKVSGVASATQSPHGMGHAMSFSVGSGGSPGVELALAGAVIFAALAAFAFMSVGQLAASADLPPGQVTQRLWPHRLALCCQLAMAVTMAHMVAGLV